MKTDQKGRPRVSQSKTTKATAKRSVRPDSDRHKREDVSKLPTVGCLFSAMGGFAKAFQIAGARVLWANEKDSFASMTFRANFPDVRHLEKPVEQLSVVDDKLQPVDILTGGFPCQPFSIAGEKRGFHDERGLLFLEIIRLITEFGRNRPKVLVLENVGSFKTHDEGRTFRRVQHEIQKAGYWFGDKDAQVLIQQRTQRYLKIDRGSLWLHSRLTIFHQTHFNFRHHCLMDRCGKYGISLI